MGKEADIYNHEKDSKAIIDEVGAVAGANKSPSGGYYDTAGRTPAGRVAAGIGGAIKEFLASGGGQIARNLPSNVAEKGYDTSNPIASIVRRPADMPGYGLPADSPLRLDNIAKPNPKPSGIAPLVQQNTASENVPASSKPLISQGITAKSTANPVIKPAAAPSLSVAPTQPKDSLPAGWKTSQEGGGVEKVSTDAQGNPVIEAIGTRGPQATPLMDYIKSNTGGISPRDDFARTTFNALENDIKTLEQDRNNYTPGGTMYTTVQELIADKRKEQAGIGKTQMTGEYGLQGERERSAVTARGQDIEASTREAARKELAAYHSGELDIKKEELSQGAKKMQFEIDKYIQSEDMTNPKNIIQAAKYLAPPKKTKSIDNEGNVVESSEPDLEAGMRELDKMLKSLGMAGIHNLKPVVKTSEWQPYK